MKKIKSLVFCITLTAATTGCASKLEIREVDVEKFTTPADGIIVNKKAAYTVSIHPVHEIFCSTSPCPTGEKITKTISGISMNKLLSVTARRMPFSSSTLTIEAQKDQTLKKVGIVGTSGTARALDAATKRSDAKTERLKLRREAREAEAELAEP